MISVIHHVHGSISAEQAEHDVSIQKQQAPPKPTGINDVN